MRTRNKVLLALGVFVLAFVVAMIVTYWVKGGVPETLIQCVLGGSSVEAFLLAGITVAKVFAGEETREREE